MHQRKTFWEIFDTFNISIVLLNAQVSRKIRKVTSNSAGAVFKLPCMFTRETKDTSVTK